MLLAEFENQPQTEVPYRNGEKNFRKTANVALLKLQLSNCSCCIYDNFMVQN